MTPFCDRLTVSVPASHNAALADVAREFGIALDGVPVDPDGLWRLPGGGTLYYQSRAKFASLEASGRALASLRAGFLFGDYLSSLGALPHRVTRLDATLDIPVRSAPELHRVYQLGKAGVLRQGRKAIKGVEVVKYLSAALYPGEDLDTGSVYVPMRKFGPKRQYLTLYDKRQERLAKGYDDPGDLLRIEASAARQKGATLSDAYRPESIFWDMVPPEVWAPPSSGVSPWTPSDEAWSGGKVQPLNSRDRLLRYLSSAAGRELVRLADFPGGLGCVRDWLASVEKGQALGLS